MSEHILKISLILLVFITTALFIRFIKLKTARFPYKKKKSVMTDAEQRIFKKLQQQYRDKYYIFPQINLDKLITVTEKRNYYTYFNKINQKSVDFVLADRQSLETVRIIELDDDTHNRKYRKKRDEFVNTLAKAIGLPIEHIKL